MENREDDLLELALAVADGKPVDWAEVESRAGDETSQELHRALHTIAGIAEAHWAWQRSAAGGGNVLSSRATSPRLGRGDAFPAGRVVGSRYRIEVLIGTGGFGRVFRALDERLKRPVALKVLFVSEDGEIRGERARRFQTEATTLARLEHRHIVPVYDAGIEDGAPWLAMKLIEGRSLADVLAEQGPLGLERALRLLAQITPALRHAHERGIIHRDVKPANLLVGRDPDSSESLWLTDFGIARLLDERALALDTALVGTPFYMAPEQVTGRPTDARTDIFALGCLAAELVTGEPLWKGDSLPAVLHSIVREPPDLEVVKARAGDAFAGIVRLCLAKSPKDRWQTVDELDRALAGLAEAKRPAPAKSAGKLQLWFWRRKPAAWDEQSPLSVQGLRKTYGFGKPVLADLDLEVARGAVYALLGRNGSGKSTLIRTCLGIYRRDAGQVRIFGRDPQVDGPAIMERLGWVPDTLLADESQRVGELIRFVAGFYPRWDNAQCHRLLARYDLPLDQRLRDLSRGMKTKVSLVLALAHHPKLLLLDDPTLGLDAVVLEEVVETLEDAVKQDGTTILIASHHYEEVERIATHVGLLKGHNLALSENLETLKARACQVQLTFAEVAPSLNGVRHFRVLKASGRRVTGVILDTRFGTLDWLRALAPREMVVDELTLREIFVNFLRGPEE